MNPGQVFSEHNIIINRQRNFKTTLLRPKSIGVNLLNNPYDPDFKIMV